MQASKTCGSRGPASASRIFWWKGSFAILFRSFVLSIDRVHQLPELDEQVLPFGKATSFDQLESLPGPLDLGRVALLQQDAHVLLILRTPCENLHGDDLGLDSGAFQEDVDHGPGFHVVGVQERRDEPDAEQPPILTQEHRLFGVIPVPPGPQAAYGFIGLEAARRGEDDVEIPGGTGLGPEHDREAADESPPQAEGTQVAVQPDQGFLEASEGQARH